MGKGGLGTSLFLQFFGDKPKFRIIDFLLDNELQDFTKTEIAKGAGLSWAALFSHWGGMEKKKKSICKSRRFLPKGIGRSDSVFSVSSGYPLSYEI